MYDLDIKEALSRLPREIVDARNQRLKRAMDLSMKHDYLPDSLQVLPSPFLLHFCCRRSFIERCLFYLLLGSWRCNMIELQIGTKAM